MLKFIEEDVDILGFSRIWATNTQDYDFFKRKGYEFDLEEAVKYF